MFNFNQLEKYTECDNTEVNEQFQNCIIRYISGRLQGWYDLMGWQWTLLFICQVDSGCSRLTGGCGQGTVHALPEHKHLVQKSTNYFDSWFSFSFYRRKEESLPYWESKPENVANDKSYDEEQITCFLLYTHKLTKTSFNDCNYLKNLCTVNTASHVPLWEVDCFIADWLDYRSCILSPQVEDILYTYSKISYEN